MLSLYKAAFSVYLYFLAEYKEISIIIQLNIPYTLLLLTLCHNGTLPIKISIKRITRIRPISPDGPYPQLLL